MSGWLQGMAAPEQHAVATDFLVADGPDLLARWDAHQGFWDARLRAGLDPHGRTATERPGPSTAVLNSAQERITGVSFACRDPLGLATHPLVCQAAVAAIERWGVHAAGSAAGQGCSLAVRALEDRLADLLCCRQAIVFPSGWAAGQAVIRTLVRADDQVVIDPRAHAGLHQAAAAATRHVHLAPQGGTEPLERRLIRMRGADARAGILVVMESLCALDSTAPDLRAVQDACRRQGATLLVSAADDFGAMGETGLGVLGDQGLIGEVDLVVGSLARCLGAQGGFVATNAPALARALLVFGGTPSGSSALPALHAAAALAAVEILRSPEGARRRRRLRENVLRLRGGLAARAFLALGQPSPIVPVALGEVAEARLMTRAALARGAVVDLIEPPTVPHGACRWRLHVMADHTQEQIDRMVAVAVAARDEAAAELDQDEA